MIKLRNRKLIIAIIVFVVLVGLFFLIKFLPKKSLLAEISFSQVVYDAKGQLLRLTLSKDQKYRIYTPLTQISPLLIEATLLQEDRYFYAHLGVNPVALSRALWHSYIKHTRLMGASTISMQVARMRYHIYSRSLLGKLKQIYYAFYLELFYSKDQILEAYLNLAPYGGNIEGVGAASVIYFNKAANTLTLSQALTLSVIPQNPVQRSPSIKDTYNLLSARNRLFQTWLTQHPEDADQKSILNLPWSLHLHKAFLAPHLTDYVLKTFTQQPIIRTTLDYKLQNLIEKISHNYLINQKQYGIHNLAIMLVDTRDMSVKSLLGSADFFNKEIEGQVNGVHAKRSPGSTLKPFIYALALDQGLIHPYSILHDASTHFGAYTPDNFDKDFLGPIRAKDALALSRNIPAISLAEQLKHPTLYEFLQKTQIARLQSAERYGLSLVLGGAEVTMAELVSLYATLVNNGVWQPLRYEQNQPANKGIPVLSAEASFLTLDMLRNNHEDSAIYQPIKLVWKTGTSSGYRDAWSVGVVGPYVLAVWIGNFDGKANSAFIGAKKAEPLFLAISQALQTQDNLPAVQPKRRNLRLTRVDVCAGSGMLPTRWCPQIVSTWFIPGKSPIKKDTIYRAIAIDNKTGLRACKFNPDVHFAVYEFWPSDLLAIFARAGVARKVPPSFMSGCDAFSGFFSQPPHIVSPQNSLIYTIASNKADQMLISLRAQTAADMQKIYWFVDNKLLGEATSAQPLLWSAKPGQYQIRVVDEQGQSDLVHIRVQLK